MKKIAETTVYGFVEKILINKSLSSFSINELYNYATIEHFVLLNEYKIIEVGPDEVNNNLLNLYYQNNLKYIFVMTNKKELSTYKCIFIS